MNLSIFSIVPIELFTNKRAGAAEESLVKAQFIHKADSVAGQIFCELSGSKSKFYRLSPLFGEHIHIAFHESSLCLILEQESSAFSLDLQSISNELSKRNVFHENIISNLEASPINKLLSDLNEWLPKSMYGAARINYVFGFYVLESEDMNPDAVLLKVLAEPSLIDMDDMLSTNCDRIAHDAYEVKQDYIDSISDVDISAHSSTFITWATIVALTKPSAHSNTASLLTALETRLQITWNRCFSISEFVDSVFDNKEKPGDIDDLYWSFVKTLDDAKSVLSSTFSSRADKLFSEMVRTSKIAGEIERLSQKVDLLEKHIEKHNQKINKKYQKTIELLLFVTAVASLSQVFFPLPMSFLPEWAEYSVMAFLGTVGILAVYKSR